MAKQQKKQDDAPEQATAPAPQPKKEQGEAKTSILSGNTIIRN